MCSINCVYCGSSNQIITFTHWSSFQFFSFSKPIKLLTFDARGWIPSEENSNPKGPTVSLSQFHLVKLTREPYSINFGNKPSSVSGCDTISESATNTWSEYKNTSDWFSTISWLNRWKVFPAFLRPNGFLINSNKPEGVVTVFVYAIWLKQYLVVCFDQVMFAKLFSAFKIINWKLWH